MMAFAVLAITNTACKKKEGCMDAKATNYDEDAKKDCSCCTYEGEVVFWVNQTSASQYWTSAPNCGQNGSMTITKNLGESKSKAYSYSVIDEDGYTWWQGTINFDANTCLKTELTL
jgi:hypothetical protein